MNNDITIESKAYAWQFSDKVAGSQRRSVTDGAARPHVMTIAHQTGKSSVTGLPVNRSKLRFDFTCLDTGGVNPSSEPLTVTLTMQKGMGINAPSSADITLAYDTIRQVLATTSADASGLNLGSNIFATQEQ